MCSRHGHRFTRLEVCPECASETIEMPTGEVGADEDREALIVESELRQVAKTAKRIAESLSAGTTSEQNCGAKYYDVYLKAIRSWSDIREPRLQREHDRRLIEHDREMRGSH